MNIFDIICDALCTKKECNTDYYIKRIETLTAELARSLGPIDIIEESTGEINPHHVIKGYDMVIADAKYITYTIEDWRNILHRLHRTLGNKYKYTENIWDCDDIALLYSAILSYSAYRVGLTKQPAFCIIWSTTHAYNGFITSDNEIFLYEPQNGNIIGKLNNNNGNMYDSKKIWFMS